MSKMEGRFTKARAIEMRCFWPPDKLAFPTVQVSERILCQPIAPRRLLNHTWAVPTSDPVMTRCPSRPLRAILPSRSSISWIGQRISSPETSGTLARKRGRNELLTYSACQSPAACPR